MDEYNTWKILMHQFRASCENFDRLWIKRRRIFDTFSIVSNLMDLVAGSEKSYRQVLSECASLYSISPAASSFSAARFKLPPHVISEIRRDNIDCWDDHSLNDTRWHGYQVFAVDGSKITLPRKLLSDGFKTPHSGYCPEALVSTLFRLKDRMVYDIRLSKQKDERQEAFHHLEYVSKNDLVIYDRGYISFNLIIEHLERGVAGVFRVPENTSFLETRKFWESTETDAIVELKPSFPTKRKAKLAYPDRYREPVFLRLIKYKIGEKTYVLATTILDNTIPPQDYIPLYSARWGAEEIYKSFKQTFSLEDFHSKTERGIEQEIEATAVLWNMSQQINQMAIPHIKKAM